MIRLGVWDEQSLMLGRQAVKQTSVFVAEQCTRDGTGRNGDWHVEDREGCRDSKGPAHQRVILHSSIAVQLGMRQIPSACLGWVESSVSASLLQLLEIVGAFASSDA